MYDHKFAFFDGTFGHLTWCGMIRDDTREVVTTRCRPGKYIKIDHGPGDAPQLCAGGSNRGATLSWSKSTDNAAIAKQFARDCGARLFKTRAEYDAAVAAANAAAPTYAEFYRT